jgi:hypothetical protein
MDGVFIQKSFYFRLIFCEEIMLVVRKTFTSSSLQVTTAIVFLLFRFEFIPFLHSP